MTKLIVLISLVFAGLLLLGWMIYRKRQTHYTWTQYLLWLIARLLTQFWWRTKLHSSLPQEAERGAVFVCNHRSSIDPFFLQVMCKRPMHWMVAREYCDHWAFGWFLRTCEVIPVNRGGIDTAATKTAIRYAQQGGLIGMFPEGRINMTEEFMLAVRPGAVHIALRAGLPLVPCYIEGSPYRGTPWSPFFIPARVGVRLGTPIDVVAEYSQAEASDELVTQIMTRVVQEIAQLAGKQEFQPKFAGRNWKPNEQEIRTDLESKRKRESN